MQIVNFLVLILVLNILLYKPILGIIEKRNRQLEDSQAEIGQLQETVEQKMAAYEEKLRLAKTSAVERKSEIIRQGAEDAKAILDAVRGEIPATIPENCPSRLQKRSWEGVSDDRAA